MDTVRNAWAPGDEPATLGQVRCQLERVQVTLQAWEGSVFGSVWKELA